MNKMKFCDLHVRILKWRDTEAVKQFQILATGDQLFNVIQTHTGAALPGADTGHSQLPDYHLF